GSGRWAAARSPSARPGSPSPTRSTCTRARCRGSWRGAPDVRRLRHLHAGRPDRDVARSTFFGLFALQHRGQESAGIAVSDGTRVTAMKDMGLVSQVFDEARLSGLEGHIAIGHTRYSTTGSTVWQNAQPVVRHAGGRTIALGHNGNL